MKILIVTPGYPSEKNKYSNGFVHARVKEYIQNGLNVTVFSFTSNKFVDTNRHRSLLEYTYEDIKVVCGDNGNLRDILKSENYDRILIHFAWRKIAQTILHYDTQTPLFIWVHGVEAISWTKRTFTLESSLISYIKFIANIPINSMQLRYLGRLYRIRLTRNIHFIFVSNWILNTFMHDVKLGADLRNMYVIPNVINTEIFRFQQKSAEKRFYVFNLRPYTTRKYANDITVDTILKLSKKSVFSKFVFNLYGNGSHFDDITEPIKNYQNVHLYKEFLSHQEIAKIHEGNGVLLMPTRQDTQGVSMCEGMSSGLVPIVSNNSAIPEYVKEDFGYLCESSDEMVSALELIAEDPEGFLLKSKLASDYIRSLCESKRVIKLEIELIRHAYGER